MASSTFRPEWTSLRTKRAISRVSDVCWRKRKLLYSIWHGWGKLIGLTYNIGVKSDIAVKLISLNHQFYQTLALQFSATRIRLQPGVRRILETLPSRVNILDLGCGNGELARELAHRNHQGFYIGLDFSSEMLAEAQRSPLETLKAFFTQVDLSSPDWFTIIQKLQPGNLEHPLDVVLAFAVLHHLPGADLRNMVLRQVRDNLASDGLFIHSEWQFLNSPRLRQRILPWESIGLNESDVDEGDYLLDWRGGGYGLRYVHHFTEEELRQLARETDFTVQHTFYSDGESSKLGLYQIWQSVRM